MAKKRQWKFWVSRTLLGMIILAGAWLVNLIWFKPFNIRNFYDKIFLELALSDPELVKVSRPAGYIFKLNEKLYRPSQDCATQLKYRKKIQTIFPNWDESL